MVIEPIKKGFPLGPLPPFASDGSPFDWSGKPLSFDGSPGLPIYGLNAAAGTLFVPRLLIVDSLIPFDATGYEKRIAALGLTIVPGLPTAPKNADDPAHPWPRMLLTGAPLAGDGTAKDPATYIGGRLLVVVRPFGDNYFSFSGGNYFSSEGNYITIDKPDSRPLCALLPPTGAGFHFTGGSPAIHIAAVPATLYADRVAADVAALAALAARFDRALIYFVKGPPGTTPTTSTPPEQVSCSAGDDAGTTIVVTAPGTTTSRPDADAVLRQLADVLFASAISDFLKYVDAAPSVETALAFFESP